MNDPLKVENNTSLQGQFTHTACFLFAASLR